MKEAGYHGTDAELRGMCVDAFRRWLDGRFQQTLDDDRRTYILGNIEQLRGGNLACWCPLDGPCHAEVLLELANVVRPGASG